MILSFGQTQSPCSNVVQPVDNMLYTIAIVLCIFWVLGLVTSTAMGGLVHVLLVIAAVVVLLRIINGRKL